MKWQIKLRSMEKKHEIIRKLKLKTICLEISHIGRWVALPNYRKSNPIIKETRLIRFIKLITIKFVDFYTASQSFHVFW